MVTKPKAELCNLSKIWLVNGICKSLLELPDAYLKHNMVILTNNALGKMVCHLESPCHDKSVFNRKIESLFWNNNVCFLLERTHWTSCYWGPSINFSF